MNSEQGLTILDLRFAVFVKLIMLLMMFVSHSFFLCGLTSLPENTRTAKRLSLGNNANLFTLLQTFLLHSLQV